MSKYKRTISLLEKICGVSIPLLLENDNGDETLVPTGLDYVFWGWFGGSKIISNGQPIICYHGSAEKFDSFNIDADKKNRSNNVKGVYFFGKKPQGDFYTGGKAGMEYACYVKMENPFYLGKTSFDSKQINLAKKFTEEITDEPNYVNAKLHMMTSQKMFPDTLNGEQKRLVLIAGGFDGMVDGSLEYGEICSLYPENIKSIYNNGRWQSGTTDIYN